MARSDRRCLRLRAAVLPLLSCLALACQSTGRTSTAAGLADGPTRWLMLPEELRQVQRMRTNREAVDWLETFWRRPTVTLSTTWTRPVITSRNRAR